MALRKVQLRFIIIFCSELNNPLSTFNFMLSFNNLPSHIQAVFIQNILKLFTRIIGSYEDDQEYGLIIEVSIFVLLYDQSLICVVAVV